jgi:hypothetical protein
VAMRYPSGVVVAVGVRLLATAIQRTLARTPTVPATIRMSPTISQFTNAPATREPGSTANRMIAPVAANISEKPIPISVTRFYIDTISVCLRLGGVLSKPAAQQEHDQRDDGQDHQDCDQHDELSFQLLEIQAQARSDAAPAAEVMLARSS